MTAASSGRLPPPLAVTAIACVVSVSCALGACKDEQGEGAGRPESRPTPVEVAPVRVDTLRETVRGVGTLKAVEQIVVRPEVSGIVETVHVADGAAVAAGDPLYTLDDATLRAREDAQKAALRAARARQRNAERTLERRARLRRDRVISEASFDAVQMEARQAAADVQRLRAELALVRRQIEDTRVTAPFAGRIAENEVDPGAWVRAGERLTTLYRTDVVEVAFRVPGRVTGRVRVGQPVRVHVDAWPDRVFEGTVDYVGPAVAEASRDLLCKARLDNAEGRLRPGSFATALVTVETRRSVPVVPEEALVATRDGYRVFVVEDGVARRRDVTVGLRTTGVAEVTAGLRAGEIVVRAGQLQVRDGASVVVEGAGTTPLPGEPPDAGPSRAAVLDAVQAPVAVGDEDAVGDGDAGGDGDARGPDARDGDADVAAESGSGERALAPAGEAARR